MRAPRARVLELFQQHRTAAITQHKSVAVLVPRAARFLGRIVARRKGLGLAEAAEATARGGHLTTTGNDDVRVSVLNRAHAEPDGVGRGGAGGDHAEIRTLQSIADREMSGDHVDDGRGYEERRDLARSHRLQVRLEILFDGPQSTDARAAHRSCACGIGLGEINAAVAYRLDPRGDAVVHELVHAARFLRRNVLCDVEVAHGAAEAGREG